MARLDSPIVKNVVVLGGSYSGARAAELLSEKLPARYRIILIDRRSHFNHVYKFVRYSVLAGHSQKGFIPYTNLLNEAPLISQDSCPRQSIAAFKHVVVQSSVLAITRTHVEVDQHLCEIEGITQAEDLEDLASLDINRSAPRSSLPNKGKECCMKNGEPCEGSKAPSKSGKRCAGTRIPYAYLIYALGVHLPSPIASPAVTKEDGVNFLKNQQELIFKSESVLIIGGGALGIQYATDIKELYPRKRVTLLHSRKRLLPLFDQRLHDEAVKRFDELGVEYILGERAVIPRGASSGVTGWETIHTESGRALRSDLRIWATGQKPNSDLLRKFAPNSVNAQGFVITKKTLQVDKAGRSNIFAIGDVIEGFGAIKAGHTGWNQAGVAVDNILKLIRRREGTDSDQSDGSLVESPLTEYTPGKPMIRLTLGLKRSISQLTNVNDPAKADVSVHEDDKEDGDWQHIWRTLKAPTDDPCI